MRILILFLLAALPLSSQPRRIVSAAPSVTEVLFALGLGSKVIGVSRFCNYPEQARRLPKVGGYLKADPERVLSLRPDLVIMQKLPNNSSDTLRRVGLNVLEVKHASLAGILLSIREIGDAAGAGRKADELVRGIEASLDEIRQKASQLPRRSLMFIVGRTPGSLDGLVAVGRGSYLNELMEIAGGRNVMEDGIAYPRISFETLIARNPDVIVDMGDMADTVAVTEEHKRSVVEMWKRLPVLQAVRRGRVHAVASDIYVVPGPRIVDAARAFAAMLHPEAGF